MNAKALEFADPLSPRPPGDETTLSLEEVDRRQVAWRRPPAGRSSAAGWLQRLTGRLHQDLAADRWQSPGEPSPAWAPPWPFGRGPRLARARTAFEEALADIDSPAADLLVLRIRRAGELPDLWHLRSRLFDVISRARSEEAAHQRVSDLDAHFRSTASRTGFGSL